MSWLVRILAIVVCASAIAAPVRADAQDLVLVEGGKAKFVIAVAKGAGKWEEQAAQDLAKYVGLMTGAKPEIVHALPAGNSPAIAIGKIALGAHPALRTALQKAAKKNPTLRADAISVQREGNRIYLAGTNDDSHYYAVTWLLNQWGCRWYLPTDFGECIPTVATLKVGKIDHSYGTPFEIRRYWISWVGDYSGYEEYKHRNFMNNEAVPNGHGLQGYTKKTPNESMAEHFKIAITDPKTAEQIANHKDLIDAFKNNKRISLGMEDGLYNSDYPLDKELLKLQYDKYFLTQSYTDCFMTLYNNISGIMLKKFPNSKARIGFLAYANLTLPPVKVQKGAKLGLGRLKGQG